MHPRSKQKVIPRLLSILSAIQGLQFLLSVAELVLEVEDVPLDPDLDVDDVSVLTSTVLPGEVDVVVVLVVSTLVRVPLVPQIFIPVLTQSYFPSHKH